MTNLHLFITASRIPRNISGICRFAGNIVRSAAWPFCYELLSQVKLPTWIIENDINYKDTRKVAMPREQATKAFSYNLSLTLSLKVTKQPHLPFLSVIQKWMRIVACTQVPLNTFHWNCMAYQRDSVIIYHIVRCSPELLKSLKILSRFIYWIFFVSHT